MCKESCKHNECRAWLTLDIVKIRKIHKKLYNTPSSSFKNRNELIFDFCKDDIFLTKIGVMYVKNNKIIRIKIDSL